MPSDQNRAFNYAVLASILIHALLLFGFSQRDAARGAAPSAPIEARLVELPDPPPAPPAPPAPVRPSVDPVVPQSARKPPATRAVPKAAPEAPVAQPAPSASPAPTPPLEAAIEMPTEPAKPYPSLAPPAAPSVERADAVDTAERADAADGVDMGSVAQYRLQILGAAPGYKIYPAVARENNWEGLVVARLVMAPNGRIASLTVQKSSGHRVLDQQALEMFRKAASAVQVPPALRGKQFAVEQLAASYYFKD